jgi:hypothetical protein
MAFKSLPQHVTAYTLYHVFNFSERKWIWQKCQCTNVAANLHYGISCTTATNFGGKSNFEIGTGFYQSNNLLATAMQLA